MNGGDRSEAKWGQLPTSQYTITSTQDATVDTDKRLTVEQQQLVTKNATLPFWVVRRYFGEYQDLWPDLDDYGILVLVRAARCYRADNPKRARFTTYATWALRKSVKQELQRIQGRRRKLRRERQEGVSPCGYSPLQQHPDHRENLSDRSDYRDWLRGSRAWVERELQRVPPKLLRPAEYLRAALGGLPVVEIARGRGVSAQRVGRQIREAIEWLRLRRESAVA